MTPLSIAGECRDLFGHVQIWKPIQLDSLSSKPLPIRWPDPFVRLFVLAKVSTFPCGCEKPN